MTETVDTPVATRARGGRPTSVAADVKVTARTEEGLTAAARVVITEAELVFAGHYPDFPIFPGVCVLECVQRAATTGEAGPLHGDLAAVESARFAGAVYPGDTLEMTLKWRRVEGGLRCDAVASTERGKAASARLRYADPGGER
ncbi:3-hydroxyacyl-ACP dehydratase FabZ family protein [Streptomyces sp. NPDC085540]|uniref:3-hydroxyacyl-ACP dehydratase FabZ family protein n=1 Tax=Streptomyces sp. NPDC085540 TaxID=3365730 RepID=UPI0037D3E0B2